MTQRMLCPACCERYASHVDPGCPVCEGHGTLVLAEPRLQEEEPRVVARAVQMYLGPAIDARGGPGGDAAVIYFRQALVDAGFIGVVPSARLAAVPDPPAEERRRMAEMASSAARQLGISALLVARQLGPDERPSSLPNGATDAETFLQHINNGQTSFGGPSGWTASITSTGEHAPVETKEELAAARRRLRPR